MKNILVGNCPAHPQTEILTNVNIIFLTLNSTSVFQPTDQTSFPKRSYSPVDLHVFYNSKMNILVSSWDLSEATTLNCSKKANISAEEELSTESFIRLDKDAVTSGSFISEADTIFGIQIMLTIILTTMATTPIMALMKHYLYARSVKKV